MTARKRALFAPLTFDCRVCKREIYTFPVSEHRHVPRGVSGEGDS